MEFKAKIKSMTQHPIRGTRLFPNQIITADNPKSDHIVPLTDSVHSQLPNSRHLTLQDPSIQYSRMAGRHTTEIGASRPQVSRLSLDFISKSRFGYGDEEGNLSQRRKKIEQQQGQKLSIEDIQLQRSFQERVGLNFSGNLFNSELLKKVESISGSPIKADLDQSRQVIDKTITLEQSLINKNEKYEDILLRLRDCERTINNQRCTIEQQRAKNIRLEQALRNNRNINEGLMRKQRQLNNKIKTIEQQYEIKLQRSLQQTKRFIQQQSDNKYEVICKVLKNQIFELKLKIIDQNNNLDQISKLTEIKIQGYKQEIEGMNCKITQILNINQSISGQLYSIQFERQRQHQQYEKTIKNFNLEIIESKSRYQQIIEYKDIEINSRINQRQQLIHNLRDAENRIMILDNFNKQSMMEIQSLRGELARNICLIGQLRNEKEQLIDLLQSKDGQIGRLVISYNNSLLTIIQFKKTIKMMQQQRQKVLILRQQDKTIICELQQRISILGNQLDNIRIDWDNKRIQLENNKIQLDNSRIQLENIMIAFNNSRIQLENKNIQLYNKNKLLDSKDIQLSNKEKQLSNKDLQLSHHRIQLSASKIQQNAIKIQLDISRKQLARYNEQRSKLLEQYEQLQQKYRLQLANRYKIQLRDRDRDKIINNLRQQIHILIQNNEENMQSKLQQLQNIRNQNLQLKIDILNKNTQYQQITQQLQINLQTSNNHNIILNKQIQNLKSNNSQLQRRVQLLQNEIDSHLNEIDKYKNEQIQRSIAVKRKQSQISERQNELKQIQQQYIELIQGQLKKISSIHNQSNQQDYIQFTTPKKSSNLSSQKQNDSPYKQKQILAEYNKQQQIYQLTLKIQQLKFMNDALNKKNSNMAIIQKIRQFEINLQKSLYEKNEIELYNVDLLNQIRQLNDRNISNQHRIQWLQNIYKQIEYSLLQTQQQLIRTKFQYINFKLMNEMHDQQVNQTYYLQVSYMHDQQVSQIHNQQIINQNNIQILIHEIDSNSQNIKSQTKSKGYQISQDISYQSCQSQVCNIYQIYQYNQSQNKIISQIIQSQLKYRQGRRQQQQFEEQIIQKINIIQVNSQDSRQNNQQYLIDDIIPYQQFIEEFYYQQHPYQVNIITVNSQDQIQNQQKSPLESSQIIEYQIQENIESSNKNNDDEGNHEQNQSNNQIEQDQSQKQLDQVENNNIEKIQENNNQQKQYSLSNLLHDLIGQLQLDKIEQNLI